MANFDWWHEYTDHKTSSVARLQCLWTGKLLGYLCFTCCMEIHCSLEILENANVTSFCVLCSYQKILIKYVKMHFSWHSNTKTKNTNPLPEPKPMPASEKNNNQVFQYTGTNNFHTWMCTVRASQDIAPRIALVLCAAWICQSSAQQVRGEFSWQCIQVRIQDQYIIQVWI